MSPAANFFEAIKEYVEFDDGSAAALRAFHPVARPHFQAIVDDFYAAIESHEDARAVIKGGDAQIERLKGTLVRWLDELLTGPYDQAYFERRARIGRMHVQIDLPQSFMPTAMDRVRVRLDAIARAHPPGDPAARDRLLRALHQILDLELAIMLETYREDLIAKGMTAERLATIGQFAASIGHELRNPLGVIESSQFLLRQHLKQAGVDDPKILRHLDKIAGEVQRSNKTITDLLELARGRPPARRQVPVRQVVDAAAAATAIPPGVTLTIDVPHDATMDADPDQLARVLANLMQNAVQAMVDEGTIVVSYAGDATQATLRVADSGPGVPAEIRGRVFEALFTTRAKGSGLGLALCRRIAEAHGGTIALEPSAAGACFAVRIPADSQAAP